MAMSSIAAFVDGGVQEAFDDSCSICLEAFCDSNPATMTLCKHEYHLQCILEWSQRSKECPMCWQPLNLKDPCSQELLDAIEQERSYHRARQLPILMQQNSMGEYEVHQVPSYTDDSDFEEQIMEHLAAAARAHIARRDWLRSRSSNVQDQSQLVVVPRYPLSLQAQHVAGSRTTIGSNFTPLSAVGPARVRPEEQSVQHLDQADRAGPRGMHVSNIHTNHTESDSTSPERYNALLESTGESMQRVGLPESLSLSESLKSRWAAASSRYKETFTKTTRGFREKLRSRNSTVTDLGARAREVSVGVVRALERISLEPTGKSTEESDAPTTSVVVCDPHTLPSTRDVERTTLELNPVLGPTTSLGPSSRSITTNREWSHPVSSDGISVMLQKATEDCSGVQGS